jgi:hypothetical protein
MPRHEDPADQPAIDWSRFDGLIAPTYTQTPDAIFDWIAPFITCTELRVLLSITRRTFGFKKQSDAISVDQMCNGIVTRDGRRLDYGTQLKRATVLAAVKGLREKNLILTHHQSGDDGGSRPTLYSLNFRQQPEAALPSAVPSFVQEAIRGSIGVDGGSLRLWTLGVSARGPRRPYSRIPASIVPDQRGTATWTPGVHRHGPTRNRYPTNRSTGDRSFEVFETDIHFRA